MVCLAWNSSSNFGFNFQRIESIENAGAFGAYYFLV
jgi:hypothetical protein